MLQQIKGIGPKVEEVLNNGGITSIEQLAAMESSDVKTILAGAGPPYNNLEPDSWIAEAKDLAARVASGEELPEMDTIEAMQKKVDEQETMKAIVANGENEVASLKYTIGVNKMKPLQAIGGDCLFMDRHLSGIHSKVNATDAKRVGSLPADQTILAIYQDTSAAEGIQPIPTDELVKLLQDFLQEKIGKRSVVIGVSMRDAKSAGQNPSDIINATKSISRLTAGTVRAKSQAIKLEYKVPAITNFDGFMPVLE